VVGAGASGVPAAVAAARCGARVLLLEQSAEPGGTMTAGLGFPVCGLFENDPAHTPRLLNGGLSGEFFAAVCKEDCDPVVAMGRVYVCRCSAGLFRRTFQQWMKNKNLTFVPQMTDLKVESVGGKIETIRFRTSNGTEQLVVPGQIIDCTGQGAVIQSSGAERIEPSILPLAGLTIRLRGVASDDFLSVKVPYQLRKAVGEGLLPAWCSFTFFSYGLSGGNEAFCKFSPPAVLTLERAAETAQRAQAILQRHLPAFCAAEIVEMSPAVLQREGVRLAGTYMLSEEDVRTGRRFDDEVALGCWPMEYWDAENGPQYAFTEENRAYGIPARCLHSVNMHNLWTAGRSISATSGALSSARVIGTAMATGEAAGKAAVESLK
jgi:hypothetical protein